MRIIIYLFIIYVRKPVNVSNLKPIKRGRYFFNFLPKGNILFNVFIFDIVDSFILTNIFLNYPR